MTAKEFLEHGNTIWKRIDDNNLTKAAMIEFAQAYHESKVKNLGLFSVSQQSELFFAFLKWAKQADLDYPDEMLLKDFEQFNAKNCG